VARRRQAGIVGQTSPASMGITLLFFGLGPKGQMG
jgi:hypothetical protein